MNLLQPRRVLSLKDLLRQNPAYQVLASKEQEHGWSCGSYNTGLCTCRNYVTNSLRLPFSLHRECM
jgi:hypothetical protein